MQLPAALARFVPELATLDDREPLAPCAHCVMAPAPHEAQVGADRVRFTASARCCTYHPRLANVLAGGALREGGVGEHQIRARLADPDGVGPLGIAPASDAARRYARRTTESFGRDASLTCPYWVEGPLGCSIHRHRNAICRTWSCRRTHGARSARVADAVKHLLYDLEAQVAEEAANALAERVPPAHDVEGWVAYYVACAAWCDRLPADAFSGPRLQRLWRSVAKARQRMEQPLPACPTPALRAWAHRDGHVELQSWSPYDPVVAPPWIFELLGRLDGQTPWPEAVAATEAALGHPVPADLVPRLWWRGCLAAPEGDEGSDIDVLPA